MKIGPDKPVVGATLVVARSRRQPVLIPLCGLHKAMVIPNAAQPHPVIAMKIGTDKPVVGATLVVARSRYQPMFIPLCGLHKAMVIPNAAQPHPVIPNAAQRSEESKILVLENAPLDRTAQCPQANSPLPPSTPVGRATLVVALPHTQHPAPSTQHPEPSLPPLRNTFYFLRLSPYIGNTNLAFDTIQNTPYHQYHDITQRPPTRPTRHRLPGRGRRAPTRARHPLRPVHLPRPQGLEPAELIPPSARPDPYRLRLRGPGRRHRLHRTGVEIPRHTRLHPQTRDRRPPLLRQPPGHGPRTRARTRRPRVPADRTPARPHTRKILLQRTPLRHLEVRRAPLPLPPGRPTRTRRRPPNPPRHRQRHLPTAPQLILSSQSLPLRGRRHRIPQSLPHRERHHTSRSLPPRGRKHNSLQSLPPRGRDTERGFLPRRRRDHTPRRYPSPRRGGLRPFRPLPNSRPTIRRGRTCPKSLPLCALRALCE